MNYKTQSIVTVSILILLMLGIGLAVNNIDNKITGATVSEDCACSVDADCNDNNICTDDYCLYPDNCKASLCLNKPIENCNS